MKERPKGTVARATAVAEGVANAVRRRQRDREPRVVLYARPGDPRILHPGAKGHDRILEIADSIVAIVGEPGATDGAPRGRARREREEPAPKEEPAPGEDGGW